MVSRIKVTLDASTASVKPSSRSKPPSSPPKPSPKVKGKQKAKEPVKKKKVGDEEAHGLAASDDEGEDELDVDEIDSDDDTGVASKM